MAYYFRGLKRRSSHRRQATWMMVFMAILVIGLAACGSESSTPQTSTGPHILTVGVTPQGNFVENFNPFLVPYGTSNLLCGF